MDQRVKLELLDRKARRGIREIPGLPAQAPVTHFSEAIRFGLELTISLDSCCWEGFP